MSIPPSVFRTVFEYFIINFSACNPKYIDILLSIDYKSPVQLINNTIIEIDLNHFRQFELWIPQQEQDEPTLTEFCNSCKVAFQCLIQFPLKYIELLSLSVRDILTIIKMLNCELDDYTLKSIDNILTKKEYNFSIQELIANSEVGSEIRANINNIYVTFKNGIQATQLRQLHSSHINQIVNINGIIIQVSKPYMKVQTLVLRCNDCMTKKIITLPPWRQGIVLPNKCTGSYTTNSDAPVVGQQQTCGLDPFIIVNEESIYVDVQQVKMQELAEEVPSGEMPTQIILNISSHLVGKLIPGALVNVIGIYTCLFDNETNSANVKQAYVHVTGINVEHTKLKSLSPIIGNIESEIKFLAQKPDIRKLIFNSIAPIIHGLENIKKSIACMLFGGSRKRLPDESSTRGDIHILLLGDPSTAKSQLLKFVYKISPIGVYTSGKGSSAAGLTAALIRDRTGNYALEGGAMILADGGVVCIDEFDKMRDSDRVAIHEAMEQQTISIAKAGINSVLTTECALLAAANPTFGTYDPTKETADQHSFETTILSRFDIIWLIRDEKNIEHDKKIASHVFNLHVMRNYQSNIHFDNKDIISPKILKAYIQYSKLNCHPIMQPDAAKTLENFYVDLRIKARNKGKARNQIPITVRQLESIVRIAESLAKMSLSNKVTTSDIEDAIRLFKLSTVNTAKSNLTDSDANITEDIQAIKKCQNAILQRLPINGKCQKSTIIRDLKLRGFMPNVINQAIILLSKNNVIVEQANKTIKRIGVGL